MYDALCYSYENENKLLEICSTYFSINCVCVRVGLIDGGGGGGGRRRGGGAHLRGGLNRENTVYIVHLNKVVPS